MRIEKAIDWQIVGQDLRTKLSKLDYNPDLKQMLKNIDNMVTDLSKLEVTARQTKREKILEPKLQKINQSIDHFEKLLLVAQLMN